MQERKKEKALILVSENGRKTTRGLLLEGERLVLELGLFDQESQKITKIFQR